MIYGADVDLHAFGLGNLIGEERGLVISDTVGLPPFSQLAPAIRFVAAVPVTGSEGERLGALCLLDGSPHTLDADEQQTLAEFGCLTAEVAESDRHAAQRARGLFDGHAALMLLLDPRTGAIVDANAAAAAFYGYSIDELTTRSLASLSTLPENRVLPALHRAFREQRSALTQRHRIASGEVRTVEALVSMVALGARSVLYLIGRDVTEQREVAERLRGTERSLRSLYDVAPMMMGVVEMVGDELRHVSGNAAAVRFFGTPDGAPAHKAPASQEDRAIQERWWNAYRESALAGEAVRFAYDHPHAHGHRRLAVVVNCIGISGEGVPQFSYIAEDATGAQEVQEALRTKSAEFERIFTAVPDAVMLADPDRVLHTINPAAARLFGYAPGELEGQSTAVLYADPETFEQLGQSRFHRDADEQPTPYRTRYRRKDGREFVGESVGVGMRGAEGETIGFVGIIRDVTKQEEAEAMLHEARKQAEEMAHLKTAFLINMSHEIRTPLTAIIGFSEVLADTVPSEHRDVADLVVRSGRRLLSTLNSVLDLARLEADEMAVRLTPLDVAAEVSEAVGLLQPLAERKGLRLEVRAPASAGLALADAALLTRIVNNLVGNAIKFTEEGGVTVEVGSEGDTVRLRVRDTGEGINEAFLPHLFDAFRQATDEATGHREGSGLGLAITKRLVDLMHGSIEVKSRKGTGTTFTVAFPRATEPAEAGQANPEEEGLREEAGVR